MDRAIDLYCRLKLPQLPKTFPEPLSEEEIQRVMLAILNDINESLPNFAIVLLFLDTGIRLDELVNLKLSKSDFAISEMSVLWPGKSLIIRAISSK